MAALRMYARSVLRHKVLGTIAVALLVGVAGGAVLTAFAGARRTDTAYPRLLGRIHSVDVVIIPRLETLDTAKIAALPNVTRVAKGVGFGLSNRHPDGTPSFDLGAGASASADGIAFYEVEQNRVLEGRIPMASRVEEILVNQTAARSLHLRVGSVYRASLSNLNELRDAPEVENPTPAQLARYFTPVDLRVVGIGLTADELLSNENQDQALIMLTPAFARRYPQKISYSFAGVELRHGQRDVPAFEAAINKALPNAQFQITTRATRLETFRSAVRPYVDSLRLFAVVAALAGVFVVAQALMRLVGTDGGDGPTLDALGATRTQRAGASLARAAITAALGAALAVVMAIALSPLLPIGPARAAEPDRGIRIDVPVLLGGFFAIAIVLLLPALWIAWRRAGSAQMTATIDRHQRPSRAVERLVGTGATASAVVGMRFALQRDRRPGAAPVGATLLGMVIAVATVAAALTFGATLDRLVTTPRAYGWSWDSLIDTYDNPARADLIHAVSTDRDLTAVTVGRRGNVVIEGRVLPAFGFDRVRGMALPSATSGRFPSRRGEVALGAKTMRDLGKSVGDRVDAVTSGGAATTLRIVGRTVLPSLSLNGTLGLGEGVALAQEGMEQLDPDADPTFFLVDIRPGVSIATIHARYDENASALGPQKPGDVRAYEQVRSTPVLLASMLALLGVGVLAHLLITQVRSRRRDLAILKAIGFSRRQVAGSVAWEATTLTAITLVVALPFGLAFGRWSWQRFADDLGIAPTVVVPVAAIALTVAAGLVIANLLAALPARTAARTAPAIVLRSE